MRQVLQSLRTGAVEVVETPCPAVRAGHVLIASRVSLISAGTERSLVEFGKASLLRKARRQPERVRQVIDKARTDGIAATLESVRSKLDEPLPLGYCNAGVVLETGEGVDHLRPGDRVVSNGPHAEVVQVPKHLCAKIPDGVSDEDAVFTVVAAVGLQGMRLAEPTLGECFAVTGLGLIGLLTVQLLRANGCRVLGIDLDPTRLELARRFGAETVNAAEADVVEAALSFSHGRAMDGVLIAASCDSDQPVRDAARMCRKRGRIVLVGVAGLHLDRTDFYEKELSFRVSCSYGPGRYDPQYEEQGADYPLGFVRWTEQRNFQAVLDLLGSGRIDPSPLVTHRYALPDAPEAYELISSPQASLGVILQHAAEEGDVRRATIRVDDGRRTAAEAPGSHVDKPLSVAVIGAGNFAKRKLIPEFRRQGAAVRCVASQSGLSAALAARSTGVGQATTDWQAAIADRSVAAVAIATRHDTHAEMTIAALQAGKHVYVEKPLAVDRRQLTRIAAAYSASRGRSPDHGTSAPLLMVGFNRRFAPAVLQIRQALDRVDAPKSFVMTVNAGALPADHWGHDPKLGGGRVIAEACHFLDLLRFLSGHAVTRVQAAMLAHTEIPTDKVSVQLSFADGSIGAVHYFANGHRSFPKERLEVFCDGRVLQLDNYRRLRSFGWPGVRSRRYWRQDKGHAGAVAAFLHAASRGDPSPIPLDELLEVAEVSFDAVEAAHSGDTLRREQTEPRARRWA